MNTEKIEKLKKGLSNSKISDDIKEKIKSEIEKLEKEDAKEKAEHESKETQAKEEVEHNEVTPKAKNVRKTTSKSTPKSTTGTKKTAMALAKEIRKEGESWTDAVKRAGREMKGIKEDVKKETKSEIAKLKSLIRTRKDLKGVSKSNLLRDGHRKALPMGKRTSATGNIYYENRREHSDKGKVGELYLAKGGEIEFQHSNLRIVGTGMDTNGNRVVKVSFPNQRAFTIQTNGTLPETHRLLRNYDEEKTEFSFREIESMEDEILDYVENYGSKKQKDSLRVYGSYLDKNNYAKGGGIPNNYEGKTPEQVWNMFTTSQKHHFLHDHNDEIESTPRSIEDNTKKSYKFLPTKVKVSFKKHIETGEYANGGMMSNMSVHDGTDFMNTPVYHRGGALPFENGGGFDDRDKQGMIYALQEHVSSGEIANMTDLLTYDSIAESRSKAIQYYVKYGDKPYSMTELKNVLSMVYTPLYHKYKSKFADGGDFMSGAYAEEGAMVNKDGIKVKSVAMPEKELTEAEWLAKHNESREARTYAVGGGIFADTFTGTTGTHYSGLVGETNAMSSGEMFADGGRVTKRYDYGGEFESPRIYVVNLEAYNNNTDEGEWLDFSDYKNADELMEAIQNLLDEWGVEEYEIQDAEYLPTPMGMDVADLRKANFEEIYELMDLAKEKDISIDDAYEEMYGENESFSDGGAVGNEKIKDWYIKNYPTDDLGEELNDEVTFEDMWNEDYKKYNIYQVMGVGDSIIRERLFEHLAEIKGVNYGVVYNKLFLTDYYAEGGAIANQQLIADAHLRPAEMFGREGIPAYEQGGNINIENPNFMNNVYARGGGVTLPRLKKGDDVLIIGRRWFDRANGNTYHTAEVQVNGNFVGKSSMTYGYDDQYVQTGKEILLQHYKLPRGMEDRSPLWQLREYGVTFRSFAYDGLKRDLAKGGGFAMHNGRKYDTGRNWTKDHNEFDKGSEHEVAYRRKKSLFADGGDFMNNVYAKGGKVSPFENMMKTNTITEKEINLIKLRMNNGKVDEETQEAIDYIWDNSPQLTPDQNKKGIDYLRNLWKSPTGKERTNNPFGYREQDTLETFEYFELRGFYDAGNYHHKFYVPLYTCVGKDSNFEYYISGGSINIVG